jgi:hypothetical protein
LGLYLRFCVRLIPHHTRISSSVLIVSHHDRHHTPWEHVRCTETALKSAAERKPEIRIEAGRGPAQVFVPQTHLPRRPKPARSTSGQVMIRLRGQPVTCLLLAAQSGEPRADGQLQRGLRGPRLSGLRLVFLLVSVLSPVAVSKVQEI